MADDTEVTLLRAVLEAARGVDSGCVDPSGCCRPQLAAAIEAHDAWRKRPTPIQAEGAD